MLAGFVAFIHCTVFSTSKAKRQHLSVLHEYKVNSFQLILCIDPLYFVDSSSVPNTFRPTRRKAKLS